MSNTLDEIHTSGSLGARAEIFQRGKGNVSGFLSPALIPLQTPSIKRTATSHCKGYDICRSSLAPFDSAGLKTPKHFLDTLFVCAAARHTGLFASCRFGTRKRNVLDPDSGPPICVRHFFNGAAIDLESDQAPVSLEIISNSVTAVFAEQGGERQNLSVALSSARPLNSVLLPYCDDKGV